MPAPFLGSGGAGPTARTVGVAGVDESPCCAAELGDDSAEGSELVGVAAEDEAPAAGSGGGSAGGIKATKEAAGADGTPAAGPGAVSAGGKEEVED